MTQRSEKNGIFWTSEGGNSFKEYFSNKPGNLFSNFDILLGTSQRTIYMKFKKKSLTSFFLAHSVLLYLKNLNICPVKPADQKPGFIIVIDQL